MHKKLTLSLFEIVGNSLCVASSDGEKVYERLSAALKEEVKVTLSFLNVELLTSAFLNAAVGQLYGEFTEEKIRELLDVQDIEPDDVALLARVVETAKLYFKDPQKFENMFGDESDE